MAGVVRLSWKVVAPEDVLTRAPTIARSKNMYNFPIPFAIERMAGAGPTCPRIRRESIAKIQLPCIAGRVQKRKLSHHDILTH